MAKRRARFIRPLFFFRDSNNPYNEGREIIMLPIIYGIAFAVGSIAVIIIRKVKQKRLDKEIAEYIEMNILMLALQNIPESTYVAMCTTFGKEKADKMLIENWRVNNLL